MKPIHVTTALALLLLACLPARAHTPVFDCFDNQDGTFTCEAGFTDGSSAEGIPVRVVNVQGKVITQSEIGEDNSVTFDKPDEEYSVIFAAGEGHEIRLFGDEIY